MNCNCQKTSNCVDDAIPDFQIKRHNTEPPFKVAISDCNGPFDLTDTAAEASMWSNGKIKYPLAADDDFFGLVNNIGFYQVLVGDIIIIGGPRTVEQMLVTGFDETNSLIRVERGYNGSTIQSYKKNTKIKIFRILNATASVEMVYEDQEQVDGTTLEDVLVKSYLVYEWTPQDTCLPGCYWLEFKLMKMKETSVAVNIDENALSYYDLSTIPDFTSYTPSQSGCIMDDNIEWMRTFPVNAEGFLIQINDSPTSELLV